MAFSKIIFNGTTLTDLTQDTVVADKLYQNYTAHGADGEPITGTSSGGGSVEDKFITVTFNNHLETGAITLYYVPAANLVNSSSGYVEMVSTVAIKSNSSATRLMPYGFGLAVRTGALTSTITQNFDVQMNNTVIDPRIEGKYSTSYYKYYNISKTNLDSSNNVIDFYSTSEPFKDTVITDTLSVTANDTYTAPLGTAYSEVTVNVPSGSPNLQDKTVSYTPSETAQSQTITADSGYDGLDEVSVSVGAISSTYVGTGIARKSSTDLTASGATVTAPAGYYAAAASKSVSSGSATTPATTVTANPTISIGSSGLITATVNASQAVTPTVSAGYVSTGTAGTITVSGSNTSQLSTVAGSTITPTESQQTAVAAGKYTTGTINVAAISSTYVGSEITQRSSTDLTASGATVTVPAGYYESAATKMVASGTEGTPTATKGTVSNHAVSVTPSVTNSAGYISGSTKTGTAISVSASELVSGTYTVDSSGTKDITNYANASIPAGTAGTPTASKGTVSNHSVSVTPSVTNQTGWITGSTKAGTAVTVTASELASGNKAITENGTNIDVVGYSTVSVDVQGGGGSGAKIGTATATPSSASASISFTGLQGEPTSFAIVSAADLATGASPYKSSAVVFDGQSIHGQYITNTSNAQMTASDSAFTKSYSNGTLTVTGTGTNWQANQYKLMYSYDGSSSNIGMDDVQVGSGATSITFTGLPDEPTAWSCIFKNNIGTSSGYTRALVVVNDGTSIYGMEMGSAAQAEANWSASYSNGSLTISSQSTSIGGYFHQPGYYQLTYVIGGEISIDIEPLTVTQNGTYSESGKAYSPVVVNVPSSGGASIGTVTTTNSSNQAKSINFTLPSGRTPKAFFARLTSQITRSSGSRYYYVENMRWDGSTTGGVAGRCFYMSSGQLTNITSGYSYSQSGTTFTLSSTGSRSASPGSFYNGTYELVYVY